MLTLASDIFEPQEWLMYLISVNLWLLYLKIIDVDYFLENTKREPQFYDNESQYINYLGNASIPTLYTDNREHLEQKSRQSFQQLKSLQKNSLLELKEIYADNLERRKEQILSKQTKAIKDYRLFGDINTVFEQIIDSSIYDAPLMLEWNTWRAMTMLDGGNIKANLKFDDFGNPMATAQGNMADIVCDYDDFGGC